VASVPPAKAVTAQGAERRPHIAEWFGHRVFPVVATSGKAASDQKNQRCPFLSETLQTDKTCVKAPASRGVCTISAASNGPRQDWLVCPYRALDDDLLADMIRRLYAVPGSAPVLIKPVTVLEDAGARGELLRAAQADDPRRAFVYFQDKLGGEIGLPKTPKSPELSFDITVAELIAQPAGHSEPEVRVGRYAVIELQTTDTHGSYSHSVTAMRNALDLHEATFHHELAGNPDWAGRRVEGPNISNVFKRTFYQVAFKFQVTRRDTSAGCVLALPQPVWDSWQPFLGAPQLHQHHDGTWRLLDDHTTHPANWIYVFDLDQTPQTSGEPAAIQTRLVIGTDAATLSRAALEIAPTAAANYGGTADVVVTAIIRRLNEYLAAVTLI
jgi:hypothetical protein